MTRYIKILFAITFIAALCSCEEGRTLSNFEAPATQDQDASGDTAQLDRFVDVVAPYNNDNDSGNNTAEFYQDPAPAAVAK